MGCIFIWQGAVDPKCQWWDQTSLMCLKACACSCNVLFLDLNKTREKKLPGVGLSGQLNGKKRKVCA